jgi:hypothetical protein
MSNSEERSSGSSADIASAAKPLRLHNSRLTLEYKPIESVQTNPRDPPGNTTKPNAAGLRMRYAGSGRCPSAEQIGFVSALLAAGARTVVATQWPINDLSSVLLMHRAFSAETKGVGFGAAIAEAAEWLRTASKTAVATALNEIACALPDTTVDSRVKITEASVLLSSSGETSFAHPQYWAPFTVSGAG